MRVLLTLLTFLFASNVYADSCNDLKNARNRSLSALNSVVTDADTSIAITKKLFEVYDLAQLANRIGNNLISEQASSIPKTRLIAVSSALEVVTTLTDLVKVTAQEFVEQNILGTVSGVVVLDGILLAQANAAISLVDSQYAAACS